MYTNSTAEIRPDLQEVVMEAAYADQYFIANRIFPLHGMPTKHGEFTRIKKGSGHLLDKPGEDWLLRAPRTPYKEVDGTHEKDNFLCRDRGLIEVVDDSEQADLARFFDSEAVAAKRVLSQILRAQEARVAAKVQDPVTWGSLEVNEAYDNDNTETVNVASDIKALKRRFKRRGEAPNTIVLTEELFDYLTGTKLLGQYFFGNQGGGQMINTQMFAEKFGFAQVLLADAVYNSAAGKKANGKDVEPVDADLKYIWKPNYIWIGNVTAGPLEAGGAGRIVYWEEMVDSEYTVATYRDEHRTSDIVRVRQYSDDKVVNENCGLLLDTGFLGE